MQPKRSIKIIKINSSTFQLTKISSTLIAKLSDKFSWLPPGYKFQARYRLLGVKGVKVRMIQADGTFPSGLFSDIFSYLTDVVHKKVEMSDDVREHFLPLTDFFEKDISDDVFSEYSFDGEPVMLRDYQLGAVKAAFDNRHCLLNLSTGSGKCLDGDTKLKIRLPDDIAEKYKHLLEH